MRGRVCHDETRVSHREQPRQRGCGARPGRRTVVPSCGAFSYLSFAAARPEKQGHLAAVVVRERPRFVVVLYPERVSEEILQSLDVGFDRTHRLDGWADWGAGAVEVWERTR